MPNAAAECCTRCLGGILQAGNVKGEDGDLCSAFSAATALEILLRRVCARGRDVHVGGACVNSTLGCYIELRAAMLSILRNHQYHIEYCCSLTG